MTGARRSSSRRSGNWKPISPYWPPLTGRWGSPELVALSPYLELDTPDPGFTTPKPLDFLSGVAVNMHMRRLPDSGRRLALAIGQADPEWPFQLLAAVGEASSLGR
ncbi:hypothetical protein ACWGQ5_23390 [Streptomyces sp. NPDC055722]